MNKTTDTATSEVGLAQFEEEIIECSEKNKNNSEKDESEKDESEKWRAILEMQNRNFLEIIKTLKNDTTNSEDNKPVVLPKFNPDLVGSDVVSWCSTAEIILSDNPLQGSALIIALSKSLLGSASQWLSTICFPGINWPSFKELIIQRFGGVETPSATIMNILNSKPNNNESLAVYGSRLVTTLISSWKSMNTEEIAVSVVLAHIGQIDNRLRRTLFTSKISSRLELQQELKAFAFSKSNENREIRELYPEPKRIKLTQNLKCHYCGKIGHKIAECRLKENNDKLAASTKSSLICYKCGQPGHIAPKCVRKDSGSKQKVPVEKVVNMCNVEPTGVLTQSGESFSFCFDTGAECSLLKESISVKFSGKRISNVVCLRGIGNNTYNI